MGVVWLSADGKVVLGQWSNSGWTSWLEELQVLLGHGGKNDASLTLLEIRVAENRAGRTLLEIQPWLELMFPGVIEKRMADLEDASNAGWDSFISKYPVIKLLTTEGKISAADCKTILAFFKNDIWSIVPSDSHLIDRIKRIIDGLEYCVKNEIGVDAL